ncbi:unnamed protein product, partial [Durusdinium trenchii]
LPSTSFHRALPSGQPSAFSVWNHHRHHLLDHHHDDVHPALHGAGQKTDLYAADLLPWYVDLSYGLGCLLLGVTFLSLDHQLVGALYGSER